MNWLKSLFMGKASNHRSNSNDSKPFDEIYADNGVFSYHKDGFNISSDNINEKISWSEIVQVNVFKVDLVTIDRIDMEIVLTDRRFTINEELPGWYQFVLKTKQVFPEISEDWDIKIIQPPFSTNFRTIYKKAN